MVSRPEPRTVRRSRAASLIHESAVVEQLDLAGIDEREQFAIQVGLTPFRELVGHPVRSPLFGWPLAAVSIARHGVEPIGRRRFGQFVRGNRRVERRSDLTKAIQNDRRAFKVRDREAIAVLAAT